VWPFRPTILTQKGDNPWSFFKFGDNWASAKCKGTIISIVVSRKSARVKWDVDSLLWNLFLKVTESLAYFYKLSLSLLVFFVDLRQACTSSGNMDDVFTSS